MYLFFYIDKWVILNFLQEPEIVPEQLDCLYQVRFAAPELPVLLVPPAFSKLVSQLK